MPAELGKDADGCFARWGDSGTRYRYACGDDKAERAALDQARAQGRAIAAQKDSVALAVTFPKASAVRGRRLELVADDGWRMAFAWGHVAHPQGDFAVDRRFAAEMIESFEYMRDTYGYYPPIAAEHAIEIDFDDGDGPQVIDGITFGVISAIETRESGIWVRPMFNALGEKVNGLGAFSYVSPSFYPEFIDPHSDRKLKNMMREFTVCGNPHQKNLETPVSEVYGLSDAGFLRPPTITSEKERRMPKEKENIDNAEDEAVEEAAEATDSMEDEMPAWAKEMLGMLAVLMPEKEGGGEAEEATENAEQLAKANKRIASLERRVALSEAIVGVQSDHPDCTEDEATDLAEIRLRNEERYQRLSKRLKAIPTETSERGRVGGGTGGAGDDDSVDEAQVRDLVVEAHKAEVARGYPLISFCAARGVDTSKVDMKKLADEVYV